MTPALYLAIAVTVLQAWDAYSTYKVLSAGGRELNPAMRWLMEQFGMVEALLLGKGAVVLVVWWAVSTLAETVALWLLGGICVFYVAIAINNWRAMKK